MTAADLLSECSRRGIRLRVEGDAIECRPASALDDSLIESMRARKPELLAELRRDAAVADAWERLRVAFEVAGRPEGWLTGAVRDAEAVVSELWVSARKRPDDDARFYPAVERWLAIAGAAIRGAVSR